MYDVSLKPTLDDTLYVVCAITNPWRYHSRYHLYKRFVKHVEHQKNVKLYTVEIAFGDRSYVVTEPNNPQHIQLRTKDELWTKENQLNIGISRLPADWKYVAWIDADIEFIRPDWAMETMHLLQHYHVLQMWSDCIDLLPSFEINQIHRSFIACYHDYINGRIPEFVIDRGSYYQGAGLSTYPHSGFAWAARREAIDALGGLIDWAILGAADYIMALALIGKADISIPHNTSEAYRHSVDEWEQRALKYIRKNIGYMPGTISHNWHGTKTNRRYMTRNQILIDTGFAPETDLKRDWQGLYQLTDRRGEKSAMLRDRLRGYFATRGEDETTPDPREKTIGLKSVKIEHTPAVEGSKTLDNLDDPKVI